MWIHIYYIIHIVIKLLQQENVGLHKYLVWSQRIVDRAVNFIRNVLPIGAFIGIHLRNGVDWVSTLLNAAFTIESLLVITLFLILNID